MEENNKLISAIPAEDIGPSDSIETAGTAETVKNVETSGTVETFRNNKTSGTVETKGTPETTGTHSKRKLPLTHSLPAKVAAFILTVISAFVFLGSAALGFLAFQSNFYTTSKEDIRKNNFMGEVERDAVNVVNHLYNDAVYGKDNAKAIVENKNIAYIKIDFSEDIANKTWSYDSGKEAGPDTFSISLYNFEGGFIPRSSEGAAGAKGNAKVNMALTKDFTYGDRYALINFYLNTVYSMRYATYAVALVSVILCISCFIFLMCASGRHQTSAVPEASFGTKIPFDLMTAGAVLAYGLFATLIMQFRGRELIEFVLAMFLMAGLLCIGLGLCMSLATRIKLGSWWKNTIIYRVLHFIWKCIKGIPLVWKTMVISCGIFLLDLLFVGLADDPEKLIYIFVRFFLILPAILYVAVMLRKLLNGSKDLAEGHLENQVETSGMVLDFKQAANNLNSIGKGMSLAVEERTKSDRMKTELITNVSHDIKTPLTSIINYSDLIMKEPAGSEKIPEYADVLHRQSEKLKRLIDDLVETSKATTGNLEVILAPCSVNEMLNQAEGEYEQRMKDAGLTLVSDVPEKAVSIMADGRRLWRVFDNLLNNACKYALSGTRVYMSLEERGKEAVITFKNTSREALNISADELMERFVRGDKSRNSGTEGNGLGLAIARSLTELQNGKLELFIDGDLFKAELRFPLI